jgi:uncharacterized protein YbjQ (UPF0145 family)
MTAGVQLRLVEFGRRGRGGPTGDPGAEANRQTAIEALRREAEDYGADGVVDVRLDVEGSKGCDIDGVQLERVTATGLAVRFAEAA